MMVVLTSDCLEFQNPNCRQIPLGEPDKDTEEVFRERERDPTESEKSVIPRWVEK